MTREAFIRKWLANPQKQYNEQSRDEMREDLDAVIAWGKKTEKRSVISRIFFPPKHDFDLENPIIEEITSTHESKLSGTKDKKKWTVTGFQCKKCGKILWLETWQMKELPRSMKYGCSH